MCRHRLRTTGILLLLFLLLPSLLRAAAANPPVPSESVQTKKGIVTAKVDRSLTMQEGNSPIKVATTDTTQVTGARGSFDKIAIGDIVRVDGRMTAERQLLAGRIEVLFAAGTTVGPQSKSSPLKGMLSVLLNGGVSVQLP
jgi:hypothetical protein